MIARYLAPDKVLAFVAALILPLAVAAPRMLPSLGIVALLALLAYRVSTLQWIRRVQLRALGAWPYILAGLLAWAAISIAWAPSVADGLKATADMTAIAIGAVIFLTAAAGLDARGSWRVGSAVVIGCAVAAVYMLAELLTGMRATRYLLALAGSSEFWQTSTKLYFSQATSVAVLLCWPATLVIYRRFGYAGAAVFLAVVVLTVSQAVNTASLIAVLFGFAVLVLARWRAQIAALVIATYCIAAALTAPAMTVLAPWALTVMDAAEIQRNSIRHRLVIWEFAAARIHERPLVGWGMDASRRLGASEKAQMRLDRDGNNVREVPVMSLHPHNGMVQVWLELGVPGVAAVLAVILLGLRWSVRRAADQWTRPACLAAMASGLMIFQISYGVWQGWWQTALWISAAIMLAVTARQPDAPGTL